MDVRGYCIKTSCPHSTDEKQTTEVVGDTCKERGTIRQKKGKTYYLRTELLGLPKTTSILKGKIKSKE